MRFGSLGLTIALVVITIPGSIGCRSVPGTGAVRNARIGDVDRLSSLPEPVEGATRSSEGPDGISSSVGPPPGTIAPSAPAVVASEPQSGRIEGAVLDDLGQPVPGARLALISDQDGIIDGRTKSDGTFGLSGLQPGRSYRLVAEWDDGRRLLSGAVSAQAPDQVQIRLSPDGTGRVGDDFDEGPTDGEPPLISSETEPIDLLVGSQGPARKMNLEDLPGQPGRLGSESMVNQDRIRPRTPTTPRSGAWSEVSGDSTGVSFKRTSTRVDGFNEPAEPSTIEPLQPIHDRYTPSEPESDALQALEPESSEYSSDSDQSSLSLDPRALLDVENSTELADAGQLLVDQFADLGTNRPRTVPDQIVSDQPPALSIAENSSPGILEPSRVIEPEATALDSYSDPFDTVLDARSSERSNDQSEQLEIALASSESNPPGGFSIARESSVPLLPTEGVLREALPDSIPARGSTTRILEPPPRRILSPPTAVDSNVGDVPGNRRPSAPVIPNEAELLASDRQRSRPTFESDRQIPPVPDVPTRSRSIGYSDDSFPTREDIVNGFQPVLDQPDLVPSNPASRPIPPGPPTLWKDVEQPFEDAPVDALSRTSNTIIADVEDDEEDPSRGPRRWLRAVSQRFDRSDRSTTDQRSGPVVPFCSFDYERQILEEFELPDLEGNSFRLTKSGDAELVLLYFWGSWYEPSVKLLPWLAGLQSRYQTDQLKVVTIAAERDGEGKPREVARVLRKLDPNFNVLIGPDRTVCPLSEALGIEYYPTFVLVDRSGRIVSQVVGSTVENQEQMVWLINDYLSP